MIVRNWMQANPITIPSTMLVSEAKRILSENHLHALPVVDDGRLRGLVTRANLLQMGQLVLQTQDPDEFNYFVSRLRVRDIMVRNPSTVRATDSMAHCLRKGRQLGVAQFPVLDGDHVVGVISANEIFQIAAHCVGASDDCAAITLGPVRLGPGVLGKIAAVAEAAGAALQALSPVSVRNDARPDGGDAGQKVIVRFHGSELREVAAALEAAGFSVIEQAESAQPALAA